MLLMCFAATIKAQKQDSFIILEPVKLKQAEIVESLSSTRKKTSTLQMPEEAVRNIKGADFIRRGNYAFEPVFRGLTTDRLNVTVDGMRVFGACTDKMDPATSYVETNNLKRITASDNAGGAAFGGTAPAGINLETRKAVFNDTRKFSGNALYGARFNALGNIAQAGLNYSSPKFATRVSGSYRNANPYKDARGNRIAHTQYNKFNIAANAKYKTGNTSWLEAQIIFDNAWDIGYAALLMDVSKARSALYNLSYHSYLQDKHNTHFFVKVYGNRIDHVMDDSQRTDVPIRMDMPGTSETAGALASVSQQRGKHKFKLNADAFTNEREAIMIMYPENEREMYMETWPLSVRTGTGINTSVNSKWKDNLQTEIFYRADFYTTEMHSEFGKKQNAIFGYRDEVRTDLLHSAGGSINIKSSKMQHSFEAKYSERVPGLSELYGFYLFNAQDGFDYLGSVNLQKEQSYQVAYELSSEIAGIDYSLSPHFHYMNNYIFGIPDFALSTMTIGAEGVKRYDNTNRAYIAGIEFAAEKEITADLFFRNTAKYRYANDWQGNPLPLIAPLRNDLTVHYTFKEWKFHVTSTAAASHTRFSTLYGEDGAPGYFIFNAGIQRNFEIKDFPLTVRADFRNITNQHYWEALDWNNIPRPGFNGGLSVSMKF